MYDSIEDTLNHKHRVCELLSEVCDLLMERGENHDNTKLDDIEKNIFDEYTPKLKDSTYGSDEYKEFLSGMKVALDHHYANNRHHPEHHTDGVDGMNLLDVLEMFIDWKSASERHANGNIFNSIKHNKDRFNISDQLCKIFENTANDMKLER